MRKGIFSKVLVAFLALFSVVSLNSCKKDEPQTPPVIDEENPETKTLTCAEAVAKALEIGDDQNPTERFTISGKVKSVSNPEYGEMTIYDETGELYLYGTYSADGSLRYPEMPDKPYKGDEIVVSTTLNTFKGQAQGKSAWIQSFKHVTVEDDKTYTKMSIKEAREAKVDAAVEVTGIVAKKTCAFGGKENGLFLVDDTNSIYVYGLELPSRVKVGNKITIKATKDYYVLDNETQFADKFGYKGACQLTDSILVSNDEGNHEWNKSWVTETTVKNLLDTPVTENNTTTIYKVNAYINKVPGSDFVNYYINDLDNTTGSYSYSQWSGKDYEWLDEFDGKICTVYLSLINYKSTATGCIARFVPIEVKDENFKFDLTNTNQFVYDYYVKDTFLDKYSANPALELVTKVNQKDLGFENVEVSYESSDTNVLTIDKVGDKTIMNTKHEKNSTPTLKVTIKYNDQVLIKEITLNLLSTTNYESLNVQQAIESTPQEYETAETCEKIIVKGVAGPSLVNQVGFYLIDETGVLAVRTTSEVMNEIKFGDLVTLEGIRAEFNSKKNENSTMFQSCILEAKLLLNEYGNHEYSTASFDNTKTLADLVGMSQNITSTTQVYTVKGQVELIDGGRFTNIKLTSTNASGEKVELLLYCSSANQYNWLKDFADKGEITMEIALCNYNNSKYYKGAVLSATGVDGVKIFNTLNYNK